MKPGHFPELLISRTKDVESADVEIFLSCVADQELLDVDQSAVKLLKTGCKVRSSKDCRVI